MGGVAEAKKRQSASTVQTSPDRAQTQSATDGKHETSLVRRDAKLESETRSNGNQMLYQLSRAMRSLILRGVTGVRERDGSRASRAESLHVRSTGAVRGALRAPPVSLTRTLHARGCIIRARVTIPPTTGVHVLANRRLHAHFVIVLIIE